MSFKNKQVNVDLKKMSIQHNLKSNAIKIHYGISIGGLFQKLSQASVEENLVTDLSHIFMKLLEELAKIAGIDLMTFYEEIIRKPKHQELINKLKLFRDNLAA